MLRTANYSNIGIYDKCDNLVNYVEFKDDSDELKCYYNVSGHILNRMYINEYDKDTNYHNEIVNSVIEFESNIMLYPITIQGETTVRAIISGETFTSFNTPGIASRVDTYQCNEDNSSSIENFTIKSNLIDEWINKL